MTNEVSRRCQKTSQVGIRRIPAYTPPIHPWLRYAPARRQDTRVNSVVRTHEAQMPPHWRLFVAGHWHTATCNCFRQSHPVSTEAGPITVSRMNVANNHRRLHTVTVNLSPSAAVKSSMLVLQWPQCIWPHQ